MNFIRVFMLSGLMLSSTVFAAAGGGGGGYGGGGLDNVRVPRTPEEMAISAYNAGLKQRDNAWEYEQRAATLGDGKKQEKLLRKAQKSYAKAIGKFEKAVERNPQMYQAWSSLGYALRKTGSYDKSLSAYEKALTINPDYYEAIEYQAEAYMQLHNYEPVKTAYARLAKEHPEYAGRLVQAIHQWLPDQDAGNSVELQAFAEWAGQLR